MRNSIIVISVILACLFIITNSSYAQSKTEIGAKGCFGFATLTGDTYGLEAMWNFGLGGLIRYNVNPQFIIQPEIILILKGTQYKEDDTEKLELSYFEFPVLAVYRPKVKGRTRPQFFAGPAVALLFRAAVGSHDIKDELNTVDIGFVIGAGIEFVRESKGNVALDARYTMGVTNIIKDSSGDSVKNGVFSLGVSYIIPF